MKLVAGKGGDGIISWDRNRYNSRMGPAGGDGGDGASIFFQVDEKIADFNHLNFPKVKAPNGSNGQKSNKQGKSASNLIIKVPKNTEIYDLNKKMKIVHLINSGESHLICKGGRGGRGNKSFKNAKLQSPWLYELGEKGEEKEILLRINSSSLICLLNFSEIENFNPSLLLNSQCELLSLSFSELQKYPQSINFCKACILLIEESRVTNHSNWEMIERFLQKFSYLRVLTILITIKNSLNIEKKILSRYGDVLTLQKEELTSEFLTLKIIDFSNSIASSLPLLSPDNTEDSEYVEYSDSLFPDKEELKIFKTEAGWEVSSQSIIYWNNRIPQTTIHNIERLKNKLKIEEIMKKLKKNGGEKGEKLKVGAFEIEIY